ncbi:MAG: helix-turn-helix transcriptional regulator [Lachnospiraceae bacterium]|nr:helix-turn-helix transcriptional regulator [Lachnospiraceae bacterium]
MTRFVIFGVVLIVLFCVATAGGVYLLVLLTKVLRTYIYSKQIHQETAETRKSLGEVLKAHRTECKMTQEFVAEYLGVSRQAVSKWESGVSDPNTSNLIALAKLFEVSPEALLKETEK